MNRFNVTKLMVLPQANALSGEKDQLHTSINDRYPVGISLVDGRFQWTKADGIMY
jgi:hypothetical protein